ncbi:hypothetical protein I6I95_07675 [Serratia plymuthica]|nr:hypothetical protein [Serratia sp. PAMC26656]QQT84725.1 hypothetical protein I6I95_07675 [Serratia plymuthica]
MGTPDYLRTEKPCVFSAPTCTLSLVAQAGQPQG